MVDSLGHSVPIVREQLMLLVMKFHSNDAFDQQNAPNLDSNNYSNENNDPKYTLKSLPEIPPPFDPTDVPALSANDWIALCQVQQKQGKHNRKYMFCPG